jgi:hypothetical protein
MEYGVTRRTSKEPLRHLFGEVVWYGMVWYDMVGLVVGDWEVNE